MTFEEKYEDVLQNLEAPIMRIYRGQPSLTDYDVMEALEALRRHYIREARKQEPTTFTLAERAQEIFDMVRGMCEVRLGRAKMTTAEGETVELNDFVISLDEIIDCLKRIERSAQRWNKSGGRQGYLKFLAEFIREGDEDTMFLYQR